MRLNAYLARAGVASRRGADGLIKAGRVKVNGALGQLNSEVNESDNVELDGKLINLPMFRYILLNKPAKTVTTLKDPQGRKTVINLLDLDLRVVPVGRLDYDTTGVLLLTNDGELAYKLMHPSFEVNKVYEAEVAGKITPEKLKRLKDGVILAPSTPNNSNFLKKVRIRSAPAKARKLADDKIELTIHEGRNHQVKRMLAAVGLPVKKLHRSRYGTLTVEGIKPGQWRDLTTREINRLKQA